MRNWDARHVALNAGASLVAVPGEAERRPGPAGVSIDSRSIKPGELFVGLGGQHSDGGSYAIEALRAGAWGVLVAPPHARAAVGAVAGSVILAHRDPQAGLQALARAWRLELRAHGTKVVAITGSTGKTSTKDILAALVCSQRFTVTSPQNYNTEIGLPLAVLGAPIETEVLVLEVAMRAAGQIAELTGIAAPDVGVILNVGPAHLELLGSLEAIAAAKAELIAGMEPGTSAVVPVREPLLRAHLREDLRVITFDDRVDGSPSADVSPRADVSLAERRPDGTVLIRAQGRDIALRPSFGQAHNLRNLVAAVAAARALGETPGGSVEVRFAARRGQRSFLPGGVVLIDDCYNANPMSMNAAIDDLAETASARRVAVLGDMLELGPEAPRYHREVGAYAAARGVELLLTVGDLAAEIGAGFGGEAYSVADAAAAVELLAELLRDGDTVLVKGSRDVGLERVADALVRGLGRPGEQLEGPLTAPCAGSGRC